MLIVLGGLPGSGKTTLARDLAGRLPALHLRIDSIEQALRNAGRPDIGAEGYLVAQQLATDNLRLGHDVIADCVNPVRASRDGWRAVAATAGSRILEIEITCSDMAEHRRRIETRQADIPGHVLPRWQDVQAHLYEAWTPDLVIDTAGRSIDSSIADILAAIRISAG